MSESDRRPINGIKVSKECLKKLKMIAISKDMTHPQLIEEILERSMKNKKIEEIEGF